MGIIKYTDTLNFSNSYQDYYAFSPPMFMLNSDCSFGYNYTCPNLSLDNNLSLPIFNFGYSNVWNTSTKTDNGSVFGFLLNRDAQTAYTPTSAATINVPELSFSKKNDSFLSTGKNTFLTSNNNSYTRLNLSNKQLTSYGFNTKEKQDAFRHLTPEMQHAVVKLTEYAKTQGIEISYNSKRSIFRTYAEQAQIYKTARPGFAAKPGHSRHESGEAVDIKIKGANANDKNDPQYKKLAAYWQRMGYTWGGNWRHCEPWHFDLRRA